MNKRICFALLGVSSLLALASSSALARTPTVKGDRTSSHGATDTPGLRARPVRLRERSPDQVDRYYDWSPKTDFDRASSPWAGGGVQ